MLRVVVIAIELIVGLGALTLGVRMLVVRAPGTAAKPAAEWILAGLLLALGVMLLAAAGLLVGGSSRARLVSLEAGVLFAGWAGCHIVFKGMRHWLQPLAVVAGLVLAFLSLLLPCPG
jgi:hypothetical protein